MNLELECFICFALDFRADDWILQRYHSSNHGDVQDHEDDPQYDNIGVEH